MVYAHVSENCLTKYRKYHNELARCWLNYKLAESSSLDSSKAFAITAARIQLHISSSSLHGESNGWFCEPQCSILTAASVF